MKNAIPLRSSVRAHLFRTGAIALGLAMNLASPVGADTEVRAAEKIGTVVMPEYRGATVRPDGNAQHHVIRFRDPVHALDTVKTGASGATSLQLLDATRVEVGPDAEIRLDEFFYDPGSGEGAGEMSFAVGAFRYVGGVMTTEENIRLHTPTATMVIRGTELVIFVWPDGSTEVNVVSGAVEVTSCQSGGGAQLLMTGMRATVSATCETGRAPVRAAEDRDISRGLPTRSGEGDPNGDGSEGNDRSSGGGGRSGGNGRGGGTSGGGSSGGGSGGGTGGGGGSIR